ncbi:MAG: hypothetical protein JNG89_05045 [Planctomycetaceae bacterium]|nr:hypothetical protein [Planctomycetaceae bacterium]
MIHIELIPDDPPTAPLPVAPGPAWFGTVSFGGCLSIGFFVMLLPAIGILRSFGITPLQSLPILLLVAVVISAVTIWRGNVYSRKLDERWKRRTETTFARTQAAARRCGYVPPSEGGSLRHRVTISHIDAIWAVEAPSLDDEGPACILRTAEGEHIYCAGKPFQEFDCDFLNETIVMELTGDLDYVESATSDGERVIVADDVVPEDVLPDGIVGGGFAILDDLDVIRRLPPIRTPGASD